MNSRCSETPTDGLLIDQVQSLLADRLMLDSAWLQTDLIDSGQLNSLNLTELVLHVENTFNLTLPFESLAVDDFRSPAAIAGLIARTRASGRTE